MEDVILRQTPVASKKLGRPLSPFDDSFVLMKWQFYDPAAVQQFGHSTRSAIADLPEKAPVPPM
ncbi:hypothetical protein [Novosphingobium sp. KA1]|uniref:hypothetical protein n=1 Tax=Novosphingobium sp. (strain KA1) TaxID=164608 RepID=UPI001A8E7B5F|nr:hypothetical protein [Novosphingobium sp. KA1]